MPAFDANIRFVYTYSPAERKTRLLLDSKQIKHQCQKYPEPLRHSISVIKAVASRPQEIAKQVSNGKRSAKVVCESDLNSGGTGMFEVVFGALTGAAASGKFKFTFIDVRTSNCVPGSIALVMCSWICMVNSPWSHLNERYSFCITMNNAANDAIHGGYLYH